MVLTAVLIVLAAVAAWYWLQPATQPGLDEGRAVAETFLTQVRTDAAAAWQTTTAEFKSASGRESFVRQVQGQPALKDPFEFISAQAVTVQDQPRTEYLFREPKGGATVRVVLGREGSAWKVDRWMLN
jgi:hypothetical protein